MHKNNIYKAKKRLSFIMILILILGFGGVTFRLAYIQIVKHNEYKTMVKKQYMTITKLKPQRGMIYDRNMNVLAKSASVWNVVISPKTFKDEKQKEVAVEGLSSLLDVEKNKIETLLKKSSYYEVVKRSIEKPLADKVREFKRENSIWSIYLLPSEKRYYLHKDFLANVLGFVGNDGEGLEGLERYYEQDLKGFDGKVIGDTNAWGTDMPNSTQKVYDAKNGNNLVLTIDANIQEIVEKHLKDAVKEHSVENRAVGIVMDVNNGEILAMATKPDYDPNEPFKVFDETKKAELEKITDETERAQTELKFLQEQWRNKAVSDPYEPGSVFKIITAAGALAEGVIKEDSDFYCPGYITVGDRSINCWRPEGHGHINFEDALVHSCNPAFVTMGLKLGQENFIKYFKAFGFKELTGIDLPGEAPCIFHNPGNFSDHTLAVSSMGQTFKTTPIQLITAVSAAINGGKLVKPHIVKQIIDENHNVISSNETVVKRQVISKKVAQIIANSCEKVVSEAGGRQAYRKGQKRGGKTGTAEQLDKQVHGEVVNYTLSFLAFAPTDNPQIAVLVLLDTPRLGQISGSVIAVPVVGRILDDIYQYMNIEPTYITSESVKSVCLPNFEGKTVEEAKEILRENNLRYNISGNKESVLGQLPAAGFYVPEKSIVTLYTDFDEGVSLVEVPDLVGKSLESAKDKLNEIGLNYMQQDSKNQENNKERAIITKQTPEAGRKVKPGSVIKLEFVYSSDTHIN